MFQHILLPLLLLPGFGPPTELDVPGYGLNPDDHHNPVLIAGDGQYLLLYADNRGDDSGWATGDNLVATRLNAAGEPQELGGIELQFPGPSRHSYTGVHTGDGWLVVWAERGQGDIDAVQLARIAPDGTVSNLQSLTDFSIGRRHISMAFDGTGATLLWRDINLDTYEESLRGAYISADGTVQGPLATLTPLSGAAPYIYAPQIVSSGAAVAAVHLSSEAGNFTVLFTPDPLAGGEAVPLATLPSTTYVPGLAAVGLDAGFAVVWDARVDDTWQFQGVRVDQAGAILAGPVNIGPADPGTYSRSPRLTFDGAGSVIVGGFSGGGHQLLTVSSSDLTTSQPAPTVVLAAPGVGIGSVACHGAQCLSAWPAWVTSYKSWIDAAPLAGDNTLAGPAHHTSTPSSDQFGLTWAQSGDTMLLLWSDTLGRDPTRLRARRRSIGADWIDVEPIEVGTVSYSQSSVATLGNGDFLLAWASPNPPDSLFVTDIFFAVVPATGPVGEVAPQLLLAASNNWGWPDAQCTANLCGITVSGSFEDTAFWTLSATDGALLNPSLSPVHTSGKPTALGDAFWFRDQFGSATLYRSETPDPAPATALVLDPDENEPRPALLAWDGSGVVALWIDQNPIDFYYHPLLKVAKAAPDALSLLEPAKQLLDEDGLVDLFSSQLTFGDGKLMWVYAQPGNNFDPRTFYLQELSSTLELQGDAELVAQGPVGDGRLFLGANDYRMFGYTERDGDPQRGSHRIKLLLPGGLLALGGNCNSAGQCGSGFCSDGVCCDTECTGGCEACALAVGASADGTCSVLAAGTECRAADGLCDAPEVCDGTSQVCPTQVTEPCPPEVVEVSEPAVEPQPEAQVEVVPDSVGPEPAPEPGPEPEPELELDVAPESGPSDGVETVADATVEMAAPPGTEGCNCQSGQDPPLSSLVLLLAVGAFLAARRRLRC